LVGVGEQEPKPEPGHGNEGARKDKIGESFLRHPTTPVLPSPLLVSQQGHCTIAAKAFRAQTVFIGLEVCARLGLSNERGSFAEGHLKLTKN
jgi:hypothetical protein